MTSLDAWATLEAELNPPDKPEGALTLIEFTARFNMKPTAASNLLKRLIDEGKVEKIPCIAANAQGSRYRTTAYLVKP